MNDLAEAPKRAWLQLLSIFWAILLAGGIISFMVAIAGSKFIETRLPGNESAAIGHLKYLESLQRLYKEQGHADYANMEDLQAAAMTGHYLEKNTVIKGYKYACQRAKSKPSEAWWATAEPALPGTTGKRFFATNHSGEIYFSTEGRIAPNLETAEILTSEKVRLAGQP